MESSQRYQTKVLGYFNLIEDLYNKICRLVFLLIGANRTIDNNIFIKKMS